MIKAATSVVLSILAFRIFDMLGLLAASVRAAVNTWAQECFRILVMGDESYFFWSTENSE